jgi:outer membrane protein OmpA-like peptidoglycan-associated protein
MRKETLSRAGILGLVALVAGLWSTPASAQERHQPFELGLYGGWYFFAAEHGLGRAENDPEGLSPKDFLEIGARFGWNFSQIVGIEGEFYVVPTKLNNEATNELIIGYRAHVILHFIKSGSFRPFAVLGWGGINSSPSDDAVIESDQDNLLYAGLGAKLALSESLLLRLDGRLSAPPAFMSGIAEIGDEANFSGIDFEVLLGLSFAFGGKDPVVEAPPPPPPEEPKDTDGDGILDADDKCPTEPEDKDGFQDEDGCPEADNDGDGLPDASDKCPNEAEDKDNFQDEDGCPDPDNDGDGVLDASDKCVNEPETKNNYQDEDGCPDTVPGPVQKYTGVIQGINFKFNSAEITRGSYRVLDRATKVLSDYPDVRLEIQGHTDNRGNPEYNKDLSQRRAESVKNYFISKGIDASRLTAVGYGMEVPIADNKRASGRAKNRRVEFKLK